MSSVLFKPAGGLDSRHSLFMITDPIWSQLKFVTGNPNKLREARQILGVNLHQADLEGLYEIQTNDVSELVRNKLEQASHRLDGPVMVEDSGLIFSAWNGLPGALVKWFEKSVRCEGMIRMLEPFEDRSATALCHVAVHDGKNIIIATGEVKGAIAKTIRGDNGFGWDVIFIPEGHERTYGEMSPEEKNSISHRRRAFEDLKMKL